MIILYAGSSNVVVFVLIYLTFLLCHNYLTLYLFSSLFQISKEFYDWWVGLGNVEFKSEIKRPEDIEDLFQVNFIFSNKKPLKIIRKKKYNCLYVFTQVWFDEHASRGLVLHPKILPCVLQSIAHYVGVPKVSTVT